MQGPKISDHTRFILENTSVLAPPHVPEIRLRLADEAHDLWQKTETELEEIGLPPPFWAFAWAGGQGLARHVLDHPGLVRGKRVLDLASGSGLVAIAARLAGARQVVANDIDPFCRPAIRINSALNGVDVEFLGNDLLQAGCNLPQCDVLLCGDVFYDREMTARLLGVLERFGERNVDILVGDPGRSYLPRDRLEWLGEYVVPVTRALEDAEVKKTVVWRFSAGAGP
ncbi:MAG: methyltransferase [Nitratireductor sp.]|nr:methyltransferase [Nitratireductor sp.]